jgi:hypothetical protein
MESPIRMASADIEATPNGTGPFSLTSCVIRSTSVDEGGNMITMIAYADPAAVLVPLCSFVVSVIILYLIIRLAVTHGILAAHRKQAELEADAARDAHLKKLLAETPAQ